ncbi:MAG: cation:proton antiporter subunit C, partial [Candidatus Altiarchaeota archaeon]
MIQLASFITAGVLFLIGLYAVVFKDNLIKKVMGLTFIGDAVNLVLIAMDYKVGGIVPIILPGMDPAEFASKAAYPLTIALVLTN